MFRQHSLDACHLSLQSVRISEYGENDAIVHARNADLHEVSMSADGVPTFDTTNDDLLIATLTVKQTGYAYRHLSNMAAAQALAVRTTGRMTPMAYAYTNLATGDTVSCPTAVLLNLPDIMANKKSGDVTIRIALPDAKVARGAFILPGTGV